MATLFPPLYKVNKNGSLSIWKIEIKEVLNLTSYNVIMTHGIEGGSSMVHEHEIEKGKAGRSTREQAELFARKKWCDKRDKELFCEQREEALQGGMMVVRPMLAKTFDFGLYGSKISRAYRIPFPAYVQIKYDGLRCLSYRDIHGVRMESRKGVVFVGFPEIRDDVESLLMSSTFYLDGELYTSEVPFEELSGWVRLKDAKILSLDSVQKALQKVEYHIYDCIDTAKPDAPFSERMHWLHTMFPEGRKGRCVLVQTFPVGYVDEVRQRHDEFVAMGHEGVMIRDGAGVYEVGRRSSYLQKYKEFQEEEFEIVGYHEGTGDEAGLVVWDCKTAAGKLFAVRPQGTFDFRRRMWVEAESHVGSFLTVKFQEYTNDGVPRFPVGKALRGDNEI